MTEQSASIVVLENETSEPVRLSIDDRDALGRIAKSISVRPVPGADDDYYLNPGNRVGAIQVGRLRFELRPKLPIERVMFLLSYGLDDKVWRPEDFGFEQEPDLFEAIVHGFASQVERALRLGPLQGYRYEEQSLQTIRGRIRFNDHIRARFGLVPPIECAFDEFTEDIEINRLLKAAILRLGAIRVRTTKTRTRLRALMSYFDGVTAVPYDPRAVPEIRFDRHTERFHGPVELARLILQGASVDARTGQFESSAFLVDLAAVFEKFVFLSLRERLGGLDGELSQHAKGRDFYLDQGRILKLEPDLSWWKGSRCLFVGDVKYKRTHPISGVQHPDMYQLLAYMTAARQPRGLLIYAKSDDLDGVEAVTQGVHLIPGAEKTIAIRALDLDVPPAAVLAQIDLVAEAIRVQLAESPLAVPVSSIEA